jgi:hypothetical protein
MVKASNQIQICHAQSPKLNGLSVALGGVVWGSAGAIAGASYTLLGAAVLFLTSLLLARRLSINFAGNLEERVSGISSIRVEPKEMPIALTRELVAA